VKWLDSRDARSAGITTPTGREFRGQFPDDNVGVDTGTPALNDTNVLSIDLASGRWTAHRGSVCLSLGAAPASDSDCVGNDIDDTEWVGTASPSTAIPRAR
jgi:hypothetical protein